MAGQMGVLHKLFVLTSRGFGQGMFSDESFDGQGGWGCTNTGVLNWHGSGNECA